MADHSLYGLDAGGYLLTNVALHALSAIVLFLALSQMTGSILPSAFVAAVFALHPLHVESVAWVSERKDTLSGLFWMLTLLAYGRYVRVPGSARYALVVVFMGLGLLSKSIVVTLPFALLLLDFWPLRRFSRDGQPTSIDRKALRDCVVEKLPMFAMAAVVSVVTYQVQNHWGAMGGEGSYLGFSFRAANALQSWVIYLWMAVWPVGLANFYPHPLDSISMFGAVACGILLVIATVFAVTQARSRPYLLFGWLWYLGTLVPVIGLVKVGMQARADRYMYLPMIGLAVVVAWGASEFAGSIPWRRGLVAFLAVVTTVSMAAGSWVQTGYWHDAEQLELRAADVVPRNYLAHARLGYIYVAKERPDKALTHFELASAFEPRYSDSLFEAASIYEQRGQSDKAMARYTAGIALNPKHAQGLRSIGMLHQMKGEEAQAISFYRRSLIVDPNQPLVANNLAWLLATATDHAVRSPSEAVEIAIGLTSTADGANAGMLDTLGAAYAAAGRFDEAVQITRRAEAMARAQGDLALADALAEHVERFSRGESL